MKFQEFNLWKIVFLLLIILFSGCTYEDHEVAELNGMIAFTYKEENTVQQKIFIINDNGENLRMLTNELPHLANPDWSPDGKYVVFTASVNGVSQVFTINSDGSNPKQITFNKYSSYSPTWSPGGKHIIFLTQNDDVADERGVPLQQGYIIASDGSGLRRFTNENDYVKSIGWYKNNNLVSVATSKTRYQLIINIVDLVGYHQNEFAEEIIVDGIPNWSPNGKELVFVPFVARTNCSGIIVFKIDNNLQECLVIENLNSPVTNKTPSWSPDGKHLVFSSNFDGDYDLYIVKPDGSGLFQVTDMPGDESEPVWALSP